MAKLGLFIICCFILFVVICFVVVVAVVVYCCCFGTYRELNPVLTVAGSSQAQIID